MAQKFTHIQRSFSGGEISSKMLMRADTEAYKQSVLEMTNFMPTMQGGAQRMPGTRFVQEIKQTEIVEEEPVESAATEARIVPYLTSGNERSLVVFTPLGLKLIRNVTDPLNSSLAVGSISGSSVTFRKQIVPNGDFFGGPQPWVLNPEQYTSRNGEGPLGVFWGPNAIIMSPRFYTISTDAVTCTLSSQAVVDEPTDRITVEYNVDYFANPPDGSGGYVFSIVISPNSDYSSPIYEQAFTDQEFPTPGSTFIRILNVDLPTTAWTGNLYYKITATATTLPRDKYSNPQFTVQYFYIYANGVSTLTEADLPTPYTAEDLPDLQYVQSPYEDKELVIVHPKHEPHKLFFDTSIMDPAYVFEPITFTNAPSVWSNNNYPAACSAYHGRLVLAGSQSFKVASGDPVSAAAETVWTTKVGLWDQFSLPEEVDPDDSVEFTTIFRSPIQWVYGHKSLLIGSTEYEYIASGDGIYSPGDLGVELHSTHGSNNVQPAAFGEAVLFPSDSGTKVRSMRYNSQDAGWISPDLTLLNPEICLPEIVRMVRLRNPHQMCLVVLSSGDMAIFHSEGELAGWSRYRLNGGSIFDVCVVGDNDGFDVPFLLVRRNINGSVRVYLEAIPNFTSVDPTLWDYTSSSVRFNFETATDTLTGLDHLEGKSVQVYDEYRFVGFFTVTEGQIVLDDEAEGTTTMTSCSVGLMHRCVMRTLPPEVADPGAMNRYSEFAVRVVGSSRPIINGERPPDRDPLTPHNVSQGTDQLKDIAVRTTGWDPYQSIEISEQIPKRCEIIGVYGNLKSNSL
jgi:hypothetical protein